MARCSPARGSAARPPERPLALLGPVVGAAGPRAASLSGPVDRARRRSVVSVSQRHRRGRRATRRLRIVAGVLAVVGAGAAAVGLRGEDAEVRATAHGVVNDDRPGINAHNSPAAAADPARPHVLAVADRIDTPAYSCSVATSANGGVNWSAVDLPLPPEAPNCFWPDVAYAADGALLVLFTALDGPNSQPVGTWVQRMIGRAPDGPPVAVTGPAAFHPRIDVAGDRVVVVWIQVQESVAGRQAGFPPGPNPLLAATSTDAGRTFGPPVQVSEPDRRVVVPEVVAAADGRVVVTALDLGDDVLDYESQHELLGGPPAEGVWRVVAWSSADGGATFGPPTVVAGDVVIPQRISVDLGAPRPGLARDARDGRLYVTWESGRASARDVFLASSDDGGATWSAPVPVARRRGTQTMPAVAVAPDGRVDVLFNDHSADPTDVRAEAALASSWDGGRSFTVAAVSRRNFDTRIGFNSFRGITVRGTQLAVLSERDRAVAFWSDTSRGTMDDNVQDLAVALVRTDDARSVRPALVALGAALVLAAAALALSTRRRR